MKKEKKKVGRPKLADKKLKNESIILIIISLACILIMGLLVYKIICIDKENSKLDGTICNDHINTCIVKDNVIDCGPNVKYMKYSVNNNEYTEVLKEEKSINVRVTDTNDLEVCYKNNSNELKCLK